MSLPTHRYAAQIIGAFMLVIALGLAVIHERAAVAWSQGLNRHGGAVTALSDDADPARVADGTMVMLSGVPVVKKRPLDALFGVSADSAELVRMVDMFQWREVAHGGVVVHEQDWVDHPVDSDAFREPRGHANTAVFPFRGKTFRADHVRLGRFVLDPVIVKALPRTPIPIQPSFAGLPANLQATFQAVDGMLVSSTRRDHPRLGDLRIRWQALPMDEVTVVAAVHGDTLTPAVGAADAQGFSVQWGRRALTDIHADLPEPPGATWWWRLFAVALAIVGAWLVLRRGCGGKVGVLLAFTSGIALMALLIGIVWLATSAVHASIALGVAVLSVVCMAHAWQRRAR